MQLEIHLLCILSECTIYLGCRIIKLSMINFLTTHRSVSCYQNHGNRNCSVTFGINEGRCISLSLTVCMDYNGWITDCINGKILNFPGSDCDRAMGQGHCWNEIM